MRPRFALSRPSNVCGVPPDTNFVSQHGMFSYRADDLAINASLAHIVCMVVEDIKLYDDVLTGR